MKNPQFENDEIYHIYNRGIEKRNAFLDKTDYFRFIHDLFEFNNSGTANPSNIRLSSRKPSQFQCLEAELPNIGKDDTERKRKLLVEILAWCLMPNHFHLLVKQLQNNGIHNFMHKLGTGYTNYFNQKNKRGGNLFQGTFKAKLVKNEGHFLYLPFYIHANPLDLIEPNWRIGEIKNLEKAKIFLNSFRYSSHLDYSGIKNIPSISQRKFLLDIFEGTKGYKKQFDEWLKQLSKKDESFKDKFEEISDLILDLE